MLSPPKRSEGKLLGWNDHLNEELSARLDALLEQGYFDSASKAAVGIAKLVSSSGMGALTDRQRYVYETEVVPILSSSPPDSEIL